MVDVTQFKYLLKQTLAPDIHRPINSKAKEATGSFRLVSKHKRKMQPRKTSTMMAPRSPSEARDNRHKKPGQAKRTLQTQWRSKENSESQKRQGELPPNQVQPRRRPPRNVAVPRIKARPGRTPKPDKAPPSANRLAGNPSSKVEGVAKMPRPTGKQKPGGRAQNPVTIGKNGTASPGKKEREPRPQRDRCPELGRSESQSTAPPKGRGPIQCLQC